MTTSRQLSDAVKADYDRIVAEDTAGAASMARWKFTRKITAWVAFGTGALTLLFLLIGVGLGSYLLFGMAVLLLVVVVPIALRAHVPEHHFPRDPVLRTRS